MKRNASKKTKQENIMKKNASKGNARHGATLKVAIVTNYVYKLIEIINISSIAINEEDDGYFCGGCRVVWCGAVWCGSVWFGLVFFGSVWSAWVGGALSLFGWWWFPSLCLARGALFPSPFAFLKRSVFFVMCFYL